MGVKERVPRGEKQALGREEWRYFASNRSLDVDFILSACNSGAGRPLSKLLRKGNWRLRAGISQPPVTALISTNKTLPPQNKPSCYGWLSLNEFSLVFLLSSPPFSGPKESCTFHRKIKPKSHESGSYAMLQKDIQTTVVTLTCLGPRAPGRG